MSCSSLLVFNVQQAFKVNLVFVVTYTPVIKWPLKRKENRKQSEILVYILLLITKNFHLNTFDFSIFSEFMGFRF